MNIKQNSDKIIGLLVNPNKLQKVIEIDNTLEEKQKLVDGLIECFYLQNDNKIIGVCNEEGKILVLELNRKIGRDIIAGPFLLFGDDYENDGFKSLSNEQISKYMRLFGKNSIEKTNEKVGKIFSIFNKEENK